jgi:hypothetical protein
VEEEKEKEDEEEEWEEEEEEEEELMSKSNIFTKLNSKCHKSL